MRRSVEIQAEWGRGVASWNALARGRRVWRSLSDRAHIVLLAAEGLTNVQIANALGINSHTARKWRNRFAEQRLEGLDDEARSGRPRCIDDDAVAEVIRKTLEETPRDATHWSTRSMARATGYAPSTIHRMWQAFFPAAPPQRDLQALGGPVLRGQGARHRRAVHGPATACPGSLCGREVPGSGPRSHPAPAAAAARPDRATHS